MTSKAVLAALACAVFSASAVAEPAYNAADVIAHFRGGKGVGATRGLCIGTESECAKAAAPKRPSTGFDMKVQFEYKSDVLTSSARENLDEFVKAARMDPSLTAAGFLVEGHTDGRGSDSYNLDLSMRRAQSVVRYLESQGIPADKLDAKGFGKQRLLVADPYSEANRRVETRLRTE